MVLKVVFTESANSVIYLPCQSVCLWPCKTPTSRCRGELWSGLRLTNFQKNVHFFQRFLKRPGLNPHFLVLRKAMVKERSPNIGLWLQKKAFVFPQDYQNVRSWTPPENKYLARKNKEKKFKYVSNRDALYLSEKSLGKSSLYITMSLCLSIFL